MAEKEGKKKAFRLTWHMVAYIFVMCLGLDLILYYYWSHDSLNESLGNALFASFLATLASAIGLAYFFISENIVAMTEEETIDDGTENDRGSLGS